MKNNVLLFLIGYILIIVAVACGKKQAELTLASPDGKMTIKMQGVKTTALDPWAITMTVTADGMEQQLTLESYLPDLTDEFVTATFSDKKCILLLKQQDDTERRLVISNGGKNEFSIIEQ